MQLILLSAVVVAVACQGHNGHTDAHVANTHAILNELRHIFGIIDTDNDGNISPGEDDAYFHKLDLNGDGKMDLAEYRVSRRHQFGPVQTTPDQDTITFGMYDSRNGMQPADGFVTIEDVKYYYSLLDANGDGMASLQEFDDYAFKLAGTIAGTNRTSVPV